MVICQRISSILAPFIFFLKIPFEKRSKSSFFRVWRQDPSGFGAPIPDAAARSSIGFCNSVSADRIVMLALKFLEASAECQYYRLLQLGIVNRIGVAASRLR